MIERKIPQNLAAYIAVFLCLQRVDSDLLNGAELAESFDFNMMSHPEWDRAKKVINTIGKTKIKLTAIWLDNRNRPRFETENEKVLICAIETVTARVPNGWGYGRPHVLLRAVRAMLRYEGIEFSLYRKGYETRKKNRPKIEALYEG